MCVFYSQGTFRHWRAATGAWVEAREATKHTPGYRTAPTAENPSARNVSSAKAEKPCLNPDGSPGHFTTCEGRKLEAGGLELP